MKIMICICPICGERLGTMAKYVDYFTWQIVDWCINCDREVIPLATPQEVE